MTGLTLLLTATVTPPPNAHGLVRLDPETRMLDYLGALEFYLKLPNDLISRIVFVENSASDLSRLQELAARYPAKPIEFLGYDGLDYPPEYGRGYGEFKLLDHAIEHSATLARLGPDDHVWKGTGRLRLLNIRTMVRTAPAKYDLYFDLRNRPIPWIELRFFSFTMAGYRRYFQGIYPKIREDLDTSKAAEMLVRAEINGILGDPMVVPRFRSQPWVEGVQGAYNTNYAHGSKNKAQYWFRAIMRRIAPQVWV